METLSYKLPRTPAKRGISYSEIPDKMLPDLQKVHALFKYLWYLKWVKLRALLALLLRLEQNAFDFSPGHMRPRYCTREISWQCFFQGWAQHYSSWTNPHCSHHLSQSQDTDKATGMPLHPLAPCEAGQQHCFAFADLWAMQPGLPLFYISENF